MVGSRPETHLAFNYLPDSDNRIVVFGYGAGRLDPESPGRFEIRVFFAEPEINDPNLKRFDKARKFRQYVPLTDFRFFGIGNVFKNQRHVSYNRNAQLFKAGMISNYCVTELSFVPDGVHMMGSFGFDQTLPDYSLSDPHITIRHKDELIFVPPLESIRFFLSSFGHFAGTFLSRLEQKLEPMDVCYADETGWVNNDTFQIAPKGDYCDIASAVQLALLMTNPDLMKLLGALGRLCSSMQDSGKTMTALFPFPDLSKDIKFMGMQKTLFINGSPMNEGIICRRIISDNRPAKFRNLKIVLKQPNGFEVGDNKNRKKEVPIVRHGRIKLIRLKKGDVSKKRGHYIWGNLPGLIESFPMMGDVALTVIRDRNPSGRNGTKTVSADGIETEGSSSSNSGPVVTPSITFKQPLLSRQLFGGQEYKPGVKAELFSRTLNSLPEPIAADEAYSILSTENAKRFKVLFDSQDSGFQLEDASQSVNKGQACILRLPAAWGKWSSGDRGNGRLVAVIESSIGGFYYYGMELETSKDTKNIAMSVTAEVTGRRLGSYDFGCILSHCVSRVRLRGRKRAPSQSYIGIWPDEVEFVDVIGDRIIHREKMKHPDILRDKMTEIITKFL